ncbi:hypothetical protein [Mesorhizobium atlanticum]|uniref:Uncharacterized protein n=1 Tax=Mesorhizobium atlanticum TaxID=2233532 RepID=A0A330GG81_9HYPH|nr:hypothetical protein [Mesorhizobium atlanticum]RAZ71644.1 hypothetical protein DPM35_30590 [Mesorhizobium atlanticum]
MVEIISKRDGSRREDAAMRRLIEQNRATITRLADHISGGSYSAGKAAKPKPEAKGLIIHSVGSARSAIEASTRIRISLNGRVIMVDENSGRQLHHIGDLKRRDGNDVFVLATKANHYFSPVDEDIAAALADLDGGRLEADYGEEQLAADIGNRLGMN